MWHFAQILPKRRTNPNRAVSILCLLGEDTDRSLIVSLCQRNQWRVSFTGDRAETERLLREHKPQIMLFDRDIAGQDWREFVACFAAASSGVCIMLLSKVIGDNLWNDLVANGGYEVLRKPLREDELTRAVRMAWSFGAAP